MDPFALFATKGTEYLLAIGYLIALPTLARWLFGNGGREPHRRPTMGAGWFPVRSGYGYHRGHTWIRPVRDDVVRVGMDDFAGKLLGDADALSLPIPGTRVHAGRRAWSLLFGDRSIPVLAPASGTVVSVNAEALAAPRLASRDPYGKGWLLELRLRDARSARSNLMEGATASAWMNDAAAALSRRISPELGPVLQDGGVPVHGIARALSPEGWPALAAELLLTETESLTGAPEPPPAA